MINVANMTPGGEPVAFDVPLLSGLLPGLVSVIALMTALLALEFRGAAHVLLPLLVAQGGLLALGAAVLALGAHDRLRQWESRVAPQSARDRVCAGLRGGAWRMGAIGTAGPLVLAIVLAWRRDEWTLVGSALAVPAICLCGSLIAVLSWHGRAPRLLLLPALAVLVILLGLPSEGVLGGAWQFAAAAAATALMWRWLTSRRALAVLAPPLPSPRPISWLRRTAAYQSWRVTSGMEPTAPVRKDSDRYRVLGMLLPLLWLPQMIGQGDRLHWFNWGAAYGGAYDGAIYGGCLLLANIVSIVCHVAPPLHWRRRLAPGGMSPERWALRKVLGSMAAAAASAMVAPRGRRSRRCWPTAGIRRRSRRHRRRRT
ncbi:MAG: hypothetical protein EOP39_10705, partial [Rubrivivax sp.]